MFSKMGCWYYYGIFVNFIRVIKFSMLFIINWMDGSSYFVVVVNVFRLIKV